MSKVRLKRVISAVAFALLIVVAVAIAFRFLGDASESRIAEDRIQLEETVRRAVVACYATEGCYPPSLEYLEENYGLRINKELYTVIYEVFSSNLMPDITVIIN